MFCMHVVRGHVFPGINLEQLPFGGLLMRAVGFRPRQPPMVYVAFLLSADITIKRLGPGQSTPHVVSHLQPAEQ